VEFTSGRYSIIIINILQGKSETGQQMHACILQHIYNPWRHDAEPCAGACDLSIQNVFNFIPCNMSYGHWKKCLCSTRSNASLISLYRITQTILIMIPTHWCLSTTRAPGRRADGPTAWPPDFGRHQPWQYDKITFEINLSLERAHVSR